MQRARLRIENEPSRGIREIKLHSLKRVKFPRYLEMGPNVTDWNCLFEQGMFKSNAWISWIFFRFGYEGMTRERKPISSLKIIEGNRNLDRRGSRSKLEKIRSRYPKMISRNERKGIVAVNPKGGTRRKGPRNVYRIRYSFASFDILLREASSIPLKITGIRTWARTITSHVPSFRT